MPAGLQLLPRKEFIITLEDGTQVPGQFGTWALKKFSDKRNMGLSEVIQTFLKQRKNTDGSLMVDENNEPIYDLSLTDSIDFIICACEYKARINNEKNFTFNEVLFCKWIDDYTYATGEVGVLMKLYAHSASEQKKTESNEPENL